MLKRERGNFAIVTRKYKGSIRSAPIRVAIVKGLPAAERMVARLTRNRTDKEIASGVRFSSRRTTEVMIFPS